MFNSEDNNSHDSTVIVFGWENLVAEMTCGMFTTKLKQSAVQHKSHTCYTFTVALGSSHDDCRDSRFDAFVLCLMFWLSMSSCIL